MIQKRFIAIGCVIGTTFVAIAILPHGELIQTLAALPLFAALTAAGLEVLRDQVRRQHEVGLAENQHRFSLAAGSHMASLAFDKQVDFCEEYVAEALNALKTLFREGPTQEALAHSNKLYAISQKHILWITRELQVKLDPFERALRRVGALDSVSHMFPDSDRHAERTNEMYRQFVEILGSENIGAEWEGEQLTDEAAISRLIQHLRDILGVEELTQLRSVIVKSALANCQPIERSKTPPNAG